MEHHIIEQTDNSIICKLTGTSNGTQFSVYLNTVRNEWTGEWFDKLEDAKQWLHNQKNHRTPK